MFTMILSTTFSSSRLIYSIGRDGLLPASLSKLDEKTHTPKVALYAVTIVIALTSGFVSLDQLANLVNIGTLVAFTVVSLGVIPLRRRKDIDNSKGLTRDLVCTSYCFCCFMFNHAISTFIRNMGCFWYLVLNWFNYLL